MTELDDTMKAQAEEARQAALDERPTEPPEGETPEEYYSRVQSVPGVFGDLNTRAEDPATANGDDVVVEQVIPVDVPEATEDLSTPPETVEDDLAEKADEEATEKRPDGNDAPSAKKGRPKK